MRQTRLISAVLLALATAASAQTKTMSLQVRKGELRSTPSYLGAIVGSAAYGDRFAVEETRGAWMRVKAKTGSASGWLHDSALTTKKVTLKAGEKDAEVAASSGELALAGKGFNSEVEAQFKAQNKEANFSAVDLMESIRIGVREMQDFLKAGAVTPKGGAQ